MNLKKKILTNFGTLLQKTLFRYPKRTNKEGRTESHDFKLVYFCGKSGIDYLNASLYSVYKTWNKLPEVIILSDGTSRDIFEKKMIKWPKKIEIIDWEKAANYYKEKGNIDLFNYSSKEVWGKKLVGILYAAEKGKILYSDSDVLWFRDPYSSFTQKNAPYLKMSEEEDTHAYSEAMINALKENSILQKKPLNAGVIYANGDFSTFPKWRELCNYLATSPDFRSEQTTFAILTNYFGESFTQNEILLKTDDKNEIVLKKYKSNYKDIYARHYVNTRPWVFWRDYLTFFKK